MILEFDLELAKLALAVGTGKIVTRNGCEVEIYDWNIGSCQQFPIRGKVFGDVTTWESWTTRGTYYDYRPLQEDDYDLFIEELI